MKKIFLKNKKLSLKFFISQLNIWEKNSKCNEIIGTDGLQFHPEIDKNDILHVFSSELCR